MFDGEPTFDTSIEVLTDIRGDLDTARFVQVLHGQVNDVQRAKELGDRTLDTRRAWRPDILGQVVAGDEGGRFHRISYFTNEELPGQEKAEASPSSLSQC